MTTPRIFIDTSFFKALIDEKDDFHSGAVQILTSLEKDKANLVTTNYILDESITLLRIRCGIDRVKDLRRSLAELKPLKIYRVFAQDDAKAWNWFWNDWSNLSFTDCTSFAVMKRLDLTHVATFDQHFKRAGFTIIKPGPVKTK